MSSMCVENSSLGILGITGDPTTLAHARLAKEALSRVEKVWIVPAYIHVEKERIIPYSDRLNIARHVVKDEMGGDLRVTVSDVEGSIGGLSYTIDTLDHIRDTQGVVPQLILGSDRVNSFTSWHQYQRILREFGVLVFERSFHPIESVRLLDGMEVINTSHINGCSGDARKAAERCDMDQLATVVGWSAAQYIISNNLYRQIND